MKKFFSLVLALVMALSLTTVAWGVNAGTYTDFKAAIGGEITLTANIDMPDEVITVTGNTVINLNGFKLNAAANTSRPFEMADGASLTINANDKATSAVVCGKYGLVNIPADNDAEIILNGGTYTANTVNGSFLKPRGNGVITIEMNNVNYTDSSAENYLIDASSYTGTDANKLNITVNGGVYNTVHGIISANGVVELNSATLNVKGVGVEVGGEHAKLVANNSTITTTGGNNPSTPTTAIAVSYGASATINGGTYTGSDNASSDGKNAVAIYTTGGSVTVNSGTLNGDVNAITGTGDYDVEITGGTVTGDFKTSGTLADDVDITVSGGNFTTADVSDYVVPGKVLVNGVVANATPAGNTISYNVKDLTVTKPDGTKEDTTGITSVIKVSSVTNTSTVNGKTTTTFVPAYYQLAAGSVAATYVECDKSVANYMFTIKNVGSVFVREMAVPAAFDATPVALYTAPKTATCGKVGANEDVYVVANGKYYATDYTVVPGAESYALVNGKMVVYYGEATAKGHNWLQATKESYDTKTGVITSVKCPDCKGVVAVFAKAGSFDGKTYVKITEGVAANYFYVAGTVTTQAPTTGTTSSTVTSAQTFDAGIAMYVGMSVMAAAGSAVVIGKKKD